MSKPQRKIATTDHDIKLWFRENAGDIQKRDPKVWQDYAKTQFRADADLVSNVTVPNNPAEQMPDRRFGVELEGFFAGKNLTKAAIRRHIETAFRHAGVAGKGWKIEGDASLRFPFEGARRELYKKRYKLYPNPLRVNAKHGEALEIVSPILKGEQGLAEFRRVAEELYKLGFRANASCGLHVHVDMTGATIEEKKRLVLAYQKNRRRYASYLTKDRLTNDYCKPNPVLTRGIIASVATQDDLFHHFCPPDANRVERFYQLNIKSLDRLGTVEWRAKEGRSYEQAEGYIRRIVRFTDQALLDANVRLPPLRAKRGPAKPPAP